MAGTSLARQLAALRVPGADSRSSASAVYSGPFLFPEAEQLTSVAALREAAAESLALLAAEDPGLSAAYALLEAEPGKEETELLVIECLYRLCPVGQSGLPSGQAFLFPVPWY
jgi:hypothetical protein